MKATLKDLQMLKTRINGHYEDSDILDKMSNISDVKPNRFYRILMILRNDYLAIKVLLNVFIADIKVLIKCFRFYDRYTTVFEDFLSTTYAFFNVWLTHQKIDPKKCERYLRHITYDFKENITELQANFSYIYKPGHIYKSTSQLLV